MLMKNATIFRICLGVLLSCYWSVAMAVIDNPEAVQAFIERMVTKHHFDARQLQSLLDAAEIKPEILAKISAPAEAMPWYKYRKIFMTEKRIAGGVSFWRQNAQTLSIVSRQTGIPEEIIIAIIGVETLYGERVGSFRVIDALATLGFAYPKRSTFFLSELEQFLILCREERLDPLQPVGSYAGAMGLPQFMPSSYRNFAVDFGHDNARDIWKNPADAIASVANYFAKHKWQKGGGIFIPALADGVAYKDLLSSELAPELSPADLQLHHVSIADDSELEPSVKLLAYEQESGDELWLGLHNYYVITRYNHSPLYALAVYQLAQAIADQYKS